MHRLHSRYRDWNRFPKDTMNTSHTVHLWNNSPWKYPEILDCTVVGYTEWYFLQSIREHLHCLHSRVVVFDSEWWPWNNHQRKELDINRITDDYTARLLIGYGTWQSLRRMHSPQLMAALNPWHREAAVPAMVHFHCRWIQCLSVWLKWCPIREQYLDILSPTK